MAEHVYDMKNKIREVGSEVIAKAPCLAPPEVKRPGREADHSPLSSAEVKDALSYSSTLHMS